MAFFSAPIFNVKPFNFYQRAPPRSSTLSSTWSSNSAYLKLILFAFLKTSFFYVYLWFQYSLVPFKWKQEITFDSSLYIARQSLFLSIFPPYLLNLYPISFPQLASCPRLLSYSDTEPGLESIPSDSLSNITFLAYAWLTAIL